MIIQSLLDTDLYKFTMQQAVFHRFAGARVEYEFRCRNQEIDLRPIVPRVRTESASLGDLRLSDGEIDYLAGLGFFAADYLEYLRGFRLDPRRVSVTETPGDGLRLEIAGSWLDTILFEVPLLAIVNEAYFALEAERAGRATADLFQEGERRLAAKLERLGQRPEIRIAEFGTRRRYSRAWHERLLELISNSDRAACFSGTSNIDLARRTGLLPVGTMAHEYLQACQTFSPLRDFQKFALRGWLDEYDGDLGIALSDVVGIDAFLRDFDGELARAYSGLRHDSGSPVEWGEKVLAHYETLGIDPRSKTLVFSDGLDIEQAIRLQERFGDRARVLFGIGTSLTNDLGVEPLNIVLKMIRCDGRPVAKISDSPGKGMCPDPDYLRRLQQIFGLAG